MLCQNRQIKRRKCTCAKHRWSRRFAGGWECRWPFHCPRRHRMPMPMATAVRLPTATAPQRLPLRRPTTRPIVSYLHNFPRDNVSLTLVGGAKQPLGDVQVGDVYDASIGMGLALNDRALISFGYDPRVSSARPGRTDACRFDAYRPGQPAGGRPVQDQRPPQLERGAEPRRHARHTRRHPDRASPDDVLIDMRATENVVCASGRRPAAFRRSHYVFTGPTPAIGSAAACCRRS